MRQYNSVSYIMKLSLSTNPNLGQQVYALSPVAKWRCNGHAIDIEMGM